MVDLFSISMVVPVYNEVSLLKQSVKKISAFMSFHFKDYEILIIESGSTDGSKQLCDKLAKVYSEVRVIHEKERRGFGSALKIGYGAARKDLVWLYTVDFPFCLETILEALPFFSKYDCVLSYRTKTTRNSAFRTIQSLVFNTLVKFMLNIKVTHVNSAFKCYKCNVIQSFPLRSNGWFIETEILYYLVRSNFSYMEIPVALNERKGGKSTVGMFTFIDTLKELISFVRMKNHE